MQSTLTLYPVSNYGFGTKEEQPERYINLGERNAAMQAKYKKEGVRRTVEGILLVHEHNHPHVLLLQVNNAFWKLPGGRLRPGEDEVTGLKRKLFKTLSPAAVSAQTEWKVGECIGMFQRPSFETPLYPYLPAHITRPKEIRKLYVLPLDVKCYFAVPANQRLLAVPLHDLYENSQKFGTVIAAIPQLLSRFKVNLSGVTPAQPGYSVEPARIESRDPRQQQQPQQPFQGVGSQLQLASPAQTVQ